MYKQVQSFSSTGAKVAQQKAAISAKAYVEEMIRTKRAEMMQGQFAVDTVGAMINKNFAVESPTSSFNVSHQDVFTIRREVGFTGSLNELSKNPSLLHWKAMDAPIKLPVGARAILISATIPQSQNTGPVSYVVKTKNMETNSKWTAGTTVDGDVYLKPHMTSPLQCNWSIYSRPNVETFDVKSLEGWDKITEESIQACITQELPEVNLTHIAHPSILTQLILMREPNISEEYFQIAKVGTDDTTGEPIQIATVNSDVAQAVLKLANHMNKQVAFSDPNKIEVEFIRADGKAINSLEGLVDASPDTGAFQAATVADQIYHTGLTLELNYVLWYPEGSQVKA